MILSGGEDYELLFSCSPEKIKIIREQLPDIIKVGRCVDYIGEYLLNIPEKIRSFQHGKL